MPSSPASPVKSAAPASTTRWAAHPGSWPRLLALQILQVTSLSITFSLAYDFSALTLVGSPRLAGGSEDGFQTARAPATGSTSPVKRPTRKKAAAALDTSAPHQLSHVSAKGQGSDTEDEDADDGPDGKEESVGRSALSVAARGGHVHYPLYQRGSELLGSSPVDLGESSTGTSCGGSRPHFATLLSKGLAVTVNGSPWRSVAAHVIEGEDEAVVVIYGLGPGRDYVVELGLVGDEDGRFADLTIDASTSAASSRTGSIAASQSSSALASSAGAAGVSAQSSAVASFAGTSAVRSRSRANSLRSRSRANSSSGNVNNTPAPAPAIAHALASSATAVAAAVAGPSALAVARPQPALASPTTKVSSAASFFSTPTSPDALHAVLDRQLAESQARAAQLANELKSHRRTSQKAEAALRANISALQKAAEKSAAGDLRARQKALALGESVKRIIGGRDDVELERERLEAEIAGGSVKDEPGLEAVEKVRQAEWEALRREATEVELERDEVVGANDRLLGEREAELAALLGKLDKLNTKHDRLTTQISSYNERLEAIAKEKADIAAGTHSVLRDVGQAHGTSAGFTPRGAAEHGGQQGRGRPAAQAKAGVTQVSSNPRGGQWKASATQRGGPSNAFPPTDGVSQPGSSTSPLQISAVPFRPLNHPGPYQYHRSSPSFTVQNPHALSSSSAGSLGVNSHAHNAQSTFLAANTQADPYTAVFADRDDPAPAEPTAFPPLPSATTTQSISSATLSPPLAVSSGFYSLPAVASSTLRTASGYPLAYQPLSRPSYASFSSASPQSSPALAHAPVVGRQQHFGSADSAFPPPSPAGSLGMPSRKGSLQGTPATSTGVKGTPDPAEQAAHIPLPLSPTFDRD